MNPADVPAAAVQAAVTGLGPSMISMENARKILAALANAGWLRDPGSVAKQALTLYGRGHSYRQIADQLEITLGQARRLVLEGRP